MHARYPRRGRVRLRQASASFAGLCRSPSAVVRVCHLGCIITAYFVPSAFRPPPSICSFEDVIGPAMDAMRNITLESFGTDYDTDGGVSCKVRAAAC